MRFAHDHQETVAGGGSCGIMVRARSSLTRKFLLICLFLPFFIGQVVRAYGWLIILGKEGLLNSFFASFGLPAVDLIYNYPAVLLGLVQYMLPFSVLLIAPAITAIGEDYELASELRDKIKQLESGD